MYLHSSLQGAVACVTNIANPVSLARRVMTDTHHCLLAGQGALTFAQKIGFPVLKDPKDLITEKNQQMYLDKLRSFSGFVKETMNTEERGSTEDVERVEKRLKGSGEIGHDTVGAVAMDCNGRIACATSTGIYLCCHDLKHYVQQRVEGKLRNRYIIE